MAVSHSKQKIFRRALRTTWDQFALRTTIHGLRYINDPNGNVYTKFLWIALCTAAFITSFSLLGTFVRQFRMNPTRVNVQSSHIPISELSFPGISFCSIKRINTNRAQALIDSLVVPDNVSKDRLLQAISHTSGFMTKVAERVDPEEMAILQKVLADNRYTVENTMISLAQPCEHFIRRCRFEGVERNCSSLFRIISTFRGYCCAFNVRGLADSESFQPQKTNYFGWSYGLTVALEPDVLYSDTSYGDGVRMLINDGRDVPADSSIEKLLPVGFETFSRITGEETTCSGDVVALSVEDRNCLFTTERALANFPDYREANCDVECRMLKTLSRCGCVPFFYPNVEGQDRICNFTKIPCLTQNFDFIFEATANDSSVPSTCSCASNCNNINYEVRTNTVPMLETDFRRDSFYETINGSYVVVHVYFGSQVFRRLRRDLLSHFVILIGNFGGVFSLFIGLSVVSFFELAIYSTVYMYRNYQLELQKSLIVDTFSKRATNLNVGSKVLNELQLTLNKY